MNAVPWLSLSMSTYEIKITNNNDNLSQGLKGQKFNTETKHTKSDFNKVHQLEHQK